MKTYEAWESNNGCEFTFADSESIKRQFADGLIPQDAKMLFCFEARYYEEAMTIYCERMGWAKYRPEGEAKECPNKCGAAFYPLGSGECPNCGQIC